MLETNRAACQDQSAENIEKRIKEKGMDSKVNRNIRPSRQAYVIFGSRCVCGSIMLDNPEKK